MKRNESFLQFTFHKNIFNSSDISSDKNKSKTCRQKLQNRFDSDDCSSSQISQKSDRSVLSILSINDSKRALRNGAEKISRTFCNVRTSIGTFSQKFRPLTKRRHLLEEGPSTPCVTPHTHSKQILGRTPTKLYSPFGIESPKYYSNKKEENKENIPNLSKRKYKTSFKSQQKSNHDLINNSNKPSQSSSLLR